jgi:hypothetical protein
MFDVVDAYISQNPTSILSKEIIEIYSSAIEIY